MNACNFFRVTTALTLALLTAACASPPATTAPIPPTVTAIPPTATPIQPTATMPTATLIPLSPTPLPTATRIPLSPTPLPTTTVVPASPTQSLSEQPDKAAFATYLNELYLTNMQPATFFELGEKICPVIAVKKEFRLAGELYDVDKGSGSPGSLTTLQPGTYQFCRPSGVPLSLPAGRYEFKVRVGDKLAAVLRIQVHLPGATPQPVAPFSEQPDEATFKTYLNEAYVSKVPPTTVFKVGEGVSIYSDVKKEISASGFAVFDAGTRSYIIPQYTVPYQLRPSVYVSFNAFRLPAGKYEFKHWISDVLVAVLPFEMR